jgi:4,5-DOPA dioxygenase extradiol
MKNCLLENNHAALIDYINLDDRVKLAVPTLDHYLPMLYVLGMQSKEDKLTFVHEGYQNKTISMRSFILE